MVKIASAYGISATRIDVRNFGPLIDEVLDGAGPILADVVLEQSQTFEPRLSSRQLPDGRIVTAPIEDMFPFLGRDELNDNILIPARSDTI